MSTVLCLDDFTCGLAEAAHVLRANGYEVLAADEDTRALELAADKPLDAVILNCHRDRDNTGLVTALRILQPLAAIVLFSGYCGVPCHQLHLADACIQKGRQRPRSCRCCGPFCVRAGTDFAARLRHEMTAKCLEVQSWRLGQNVWQ